MVVYGYKCRSNEFVSFLSIRLAFYNKTILWEMTGSLDDMINFRVM